MGESARPLNFSNRTGASILVTASAPQVGGITRAASHQQGTTDRIRERLWSRAQEYLASEQLSAVLLTLESRLARDPGNIGAHLLLSGFAWQDNRRLDAMRHAHAAAHIVPHEGRGFVSVISAVIRIGRSAMARDLVERSYASHLADLRGDMAD